MTTSINQPKTVVGSSSKSQGTSTSSKQVAMATEVEVTPNWHMRYWKCRGLGHGKRDCSTDMSSEGKSSGQTSTNNEKKMQHRRANKQRHKVEVQQAIDYQSALMDLVDGLDIQKFSVGSKIHK